MKLTFPTLDLKFLARYTFSLALLFAFIAAVLLLTPGIGFAADGTPADAPVSLPFWTLLAGSIVPLIGYVLNYNAPWVSEKTKAIVQVIAAAVAGALFELITTGSVGFDNKTGEYVATTVISALFAHKFLWQPSTISKAFGGGENRQPNL